MINLLSPDDRRQLAAARTNTLLRRYVILLGLVIVVLVIEMAGVSLFLKMDKQRSEQLIAENEQKTIEFNTTKAEAAKFTSDLATAKFILDKQVDYVAMLTGVARALPRDATLDTLSLNPETFGTPTTMTIRTSSYGSAVEVKKVMQTSPLFSDVSFLSVTRQDTESDPRPYTAVYNVTFSKEMLSS